jgi:hypothetical protein
MHFSRVSAGEALVTNGDAVVAQERARLIDHFKRAYQIIVGLAITGACTKLFADGVVKFPLDVSVWLFGAFFITVVPIFHGGDRSLDVKYLREQPTGFWKRFFYIWDVYILLITAILFVKIAQAIPDAPAAAAKAVPTGVAQVVPGASTQPAPSTPEHFYFWMAVMLFFDAAVLVIDGVKSNLLLRYGKWIVINVVLASICLWAKAQPGVWPGLSVNTTAEIVFGFALLRTFLDYIFGGDFMFP